jgi:hypothetical protein
MNFVLQISETHRIESEIQPKFVRFGWDRFFFPKWILEPCSKQPEVERNLKVVLVLHSYYFFINQLNFTPFLDVYCFEDDKADDAEPKYH